MDPSASTGSPSAWCLPRRRRLPAWNDDPRPQRQQLLDHVGADKSATAGDRHAGAGEIGLGVGMKVAGLDGALVGHGLRFTIGDGGDGLTDAVASSSLARNPRWIDGF